MARTSQARLCLWCRSQLCLIPVLVHNSHLSSGVLRSSESSMLYFDLHLYHSTRFARPCLARGKPLVPPVHIFYSSLGTPWHSLRSASLPEASPLDLPVHMFNPSSDTHFILIIKVKLLSNLSNPDHQWLVVVVVGHCDHGHM